MPAPKGNQNAKGNKGGKGGPDKYRPEYAEQARKLCNMGFTDADLGDFFGVDERTINRWKLDHVEFMSALCMGKEVADNVVERATFLGITGFTRRVKKVIGSGKNARVEEVEEFYPPNPGVGLRWLAARKPEVYREKSETTPKIDVGEKFLKLLDHIEAKGRKELADPDFRQKLIDKKNAIDLTPTR